jgi:hypothetical protein
VRPTKKLGECWSPTAAANKQTYQVFLNPRMTNPVQIAHTTIHELLHAVVGVECGHRGPFAKLARALGFAGQLTKSTWSPEAELLCRERLLKLGPYPRPSFDALQAPKKKQKTRLLKVFCDCGYTMRVTSKWLQVGIPCCPNPDCYAYEQEMAVEWPEGEEPEGGEGN